MAMQWLCFSAIAAEVGGATTAAPAKGPLRPHPANPRYFTDGSGKAILLVGSHTWGNLQDYTYERVRSPPAMDFGAYLAFLKQRFSWGC